MRPGECLTAILITPALLTILVFSLELLSTVLVDHLHVVSDHLGDGILLERWPHS
ncbi:MAG: hypothetical protein R3B95_03405 [Nitrospirales bacterium]|nr:hypothetical protein [Nitrospirales bacterium]